MRFQMLRWGLLCWLLVAAPVAFAQSYVEYRQAPAEIADLFKASDAVVLVQVTGRRRVPQDASFTMTEYPVIVLERFKGSVPSHGPGLTVKRRGGTAAETAESGFPLFEAGDKYLLFLRFQAALGGLSPAFGPDGAVRVDPSGQLQPVGRQDIALKFRGRRTTDLIAELRKLSLQ